MAGKYKAVFIREGIKDSRSLKTLDEAELFLQAYERKGYMPLGIVSIYHEMIKWYGYDKKTGKVKRSKERKEPKKRRELKQHALVRQYRQRCKRGSYERDLFKVH